MKSINLILIISLTILRVDLYAQSPNKHPAVRQPIVDDWIARANNTDPQQLEGDGPWRCKTGWEEGNQYLAYGETNAVARRKYLLKCLQSECQGLGEQIDSSYKRIQNLTDQALSDFAQGVGYSSPEITDILKNRRDAPPKDLRKIDCANATPLARMFVFDACFTVPVECATREAEAEVLSPPETPSPEEGFY